MGFLFYLMGTLFTFVRVNYYLQQYAVREQLIQPSPKKELGLVVVIPCCNESTALDTIESLHQCDRPSSSVEVIFVVNASESASREVIEQNQQTVRQIEKWKQANNLWFQLFAIEENSLPKKHAGVGLARKIGMDEAVRRFEAVGQDGVIVCFDADSSCDTNYLIEIEKHFNKYPKTPACSIHFEHPISGTTFPQRIYDGILQYELHLRYYKNGLAYAGLPYAYHTIGSSMAVKSSAYQKQNGMNKRKAGEDFYFLQKLIPLGDFTELKTTKVIPSPRTSDRVPFGTGKAMQDWMDESTNEQKTYNVQSFEDLKILNNHVGELHEQRFEVLPDSLKVFFKTIEFEEQLPKLIQNSRSETHFVELFYKWFNAFRVLKFMHFARDHYYPNQLVSQASKDLLKHFNVNVTEDCRLLLDAYRSLDLS